MSEVGSSKQSLPRPKMRSNISRADYIQELARYTGVSVPRHVFAPSADLEIILEHLANVTDEFARYQQLYLERTTPETSASTDAQDAAKWRALRGSARITAMGAAGLGAHRRRENHYAHLTLNFWTIHDAPSDSNALAWLDEYVEIARRAQGLSEKATRCLVEPVGGNVGDYPLCDKFPDCPCGGPHPEKTNEIPFDAKASDPVPPCAHPQSHRRRDGLANPWCGACGASLPRGESR